MKNARRDYVSLVAEDLMNTLNLSPADERRLNEIAANLGIGLLQNENQKIVWGKLKRYWEIEHHELPIIESELHLQRHEMCHYILSFNEWYEPIGERKSIEGKYFDMTSLKRFYTQEENAGGRGANLKLIDRGTICLTSKRLIFLGSDKQSSIRLEAIVGISPLRDGIILHKIKGKDRKVILNGRPDIFAVLLMRLLNELL